MTGTFTSATFCAFRQWIVLLISALCLSSACRGGEACPPDATAPGVRISVAAYRQYGGALVGAGYVAAGETIILRVCIFHLPVEPFTGDTLSSVEHGSLTITFNGQTTDVTPQGGIPLIGQSCDGLALVESRNLLYTIGEADALGGAILVRADYTNGVAQLTIPTPVHATANTYVRVARPRGEGEAGRLAIHKTESGHALLSFNGQLQKTYRVEATSDFAHWSSLGTVLPDSSGHCQIEDLEADSHAYRFYRYVVEN